MLRRIVNCQQFCVCKITAAIDGIFKCFRRMPCRTQFSARAFAGRLVAEAGLPGLAGADNPIEDMGTGSNQAADRVACLKGIDNGAVLFDWRYATRPWLERAR